MQYVMVALVVAGSAAALSGCGSTKTITETNTVVKENTTTVTTTATETAPGPTTAASVAAPPPGSAPVLSGSYALNQTGGPGDTNLPTNPHDGVFSQDKQWTFMHGSCTASSCTVTLRRTMSDSTIEDLTLFSNSGPAGVYTGTIPGGDGDAYCFGSNAGARVKLSMIVRVGGLQSTSGQTVAQRLQGHIFADYQCPGKGPTHDVVTYDGTLS